VIVRWLRRVDEAFENANPFAVLLGYWLLVATFLFLLVLFSF
jgi:hypothetical protein